LEMRNVGSTQKLEWWATRPRRSCAISFSRFNRIHTAVWQTDRQTHGPWLVPHLRMRSRGRNHCLHLLRVQYWRSLLSHSITIQSTHCTVAGCQKRQNHHAGHLNKKKTRAHTHKEITYEHKTTKKERKDSEITQYDW